MSLLLSIVLFVLIELSHQACSDHYLPIESCVGLTADTLIAEEAKAYTCQYDEMTGLGDPPTVGTCTLTCPPGSKMYALLPDFNVHIPITDAYFDSENWLVKQENLDRVSIGKGIRFGCATSSLEIRE